MAEIRIESKPVVFGYDHAYLVFVDDSGAEFVIRGGPFLSAPPWGAIVVEVGNPMIDANSTEDFRPNTPEARAERGSTVLDLGGRDAAAVWQEMLQIAQTIQDAQVTYDLDLVGDTGGTQNSNSLVSAVMAHAGLDMGAYVPLIAGDDNVGVANTIGQIAYAIDMSGIPEYSGDDILVGGRMGDTLNGGKGCDDCGADRHGGTRHNYPGGTC